MTALFSCVPTLALSTIYCLYQVYLRDGQRRRTALRARVAYMLWVIAAEVPEPAACPCEQA